MMKLVRVVCEGRRPFVAGFETDGVVRRCAPILRKHILGKTDDEARAIIAGLGWRASVVSPEAEREAARRRIEAAGGKGIREYMAEDRADDAFAREVSP